MKMLQTIIGIFVFAFCTLTATAASIEIMECQTDVQGKLYEKLKSHATIKNTKSDTVYIQVVATPTLAEGHEIQICTKESCNAPTNKKFTSKAFAMAPGEIVGGDSTYLALITDDDVDFDGEPDGKVGVSTVNIAYENANDLKDKVSYQVTFTVDSGTSVEVWREVSDVYPNPVADVVTIQLHNVLQHNSVAVIYNENGETVASEKISAGTSRFSLSVQSLMTGNYYFAVTDGNSNRFNGKFVVK